MVVSSYKRPPPKYGRLDEGRSIRNPPNAIDVLFADRRQGVWTADRLKSEDVASCAAELMKLKHLGVRMLSKRTDQGGSPWRIRPSTANHR